MSTRPFAETTLTTEEIAELSAFLASEAVPPDSMDFWELQGFLTAIASAPSAIMPSIWLPSLYGDDTLFADADAARTTNGLAVKLCNQISDALQRGEAFQPSGPPSREHAASWAQGYVSGARLDAKWRSDDMGAALLLPFGVLAGVFDLAGHSNADERPIEDTSEYHDKYYDALEQAALTLHRYWRPRRSSLSGPRRRRLSKQGSCLCGSGMEFIRCCGRTRTS